MSAHRQVRVRAIVVVGVSMMLAVAARSGILVHGPVLCPLRRLTEIPCASCGLTRAMTALAQGDLWTALSFHLAVVPVACVLLGTLLLVFGEIVTGREVVKPVWMRWRRGVTWSAVVVLGVGWTRNLMDSF